MPVEALAQANNIASTTSLQVGQALTIPSRIQVQRLEREAANAQQAREDKRDAQENSAKHVKKSKKQMLKAVLGCKLPWRTIRPLRMKWQGSSNQQAIKSRPAQPAAAYESSLVLNAAKLLR